MLIWAAVGSSAAAEAALIPLKGLGLDSRLPTERNVSILSGSFKRMFSTVDDFGSWRGRIAGFEVELFGYPDRPPNLIEIFNDRDRVEETFGLDAAAATPGNCDPTRCEVAFYGCHSGHCHIEVKTTYPQPKTQRDPAHPGYTSVAWSDEGFDPTPYPWYLIRLDPSL